jgi:hypothetical protein
MLVRHEEIAEQVAVADGKSRDTAEEAKATDSVSSIANCRFELHKYQHAQ